MKKNNLIIGGSNGLGKEICKFLPKDDLKIVLDKNDYNGDEHVNFIKLDVTNYDELKLILEKKITEKLSIDNVFICHGHHHSKPAHNVSLEEFKKIFEINFFSVVEIIKKIEPLLKSNSKVFIISSLSACTPIPYSSTYSSSKSALEAFTMSLINEYNFKNINYIIIQPGNINTGFNESGNNYNLKNNKDFELYKKVVSQIDSKYGMKPENVAKKIIRISQNIKPKNKYIIGKNAILANLAKRILGDNFSNKLLKRYFKLS